MACVHADGFLSGYQVFTPLFSLLPPVQPFFKSVGPKGGYLFTHEENAYDDYAHISRPMTPQGILKKGSFRHEDREGPNLGTIPSKSKFLKLGKMKFRCWHCDQPVSEARVLPSSF